MLEIHPSSLPSFLDCQRRTAARVIAGTVRDAGFELRSLPVGIGAITGTASHAAVATMHRAQIKAGDPTLWPVGDAIEVGMESIAANIVNGVTWDTTSPTLNTAQKQVARQVRMYAQSVSPGVPVAAEERLTAVISKGRAVLDGTVDRREDVRIRDLKTGRVRRANGVQYGAYSLLQRTHGNTVDELIEDYLPRVPLTKPQPPVVPIRHNVAEAEQAAMAIITRMIDAVTRFEATGNPWEFLPNPMSQMCSDRFCPAHSTPFCTAHKDAI